ncbi:hypothetical protein PPL_05621 [Heterostelium album PN500]|uniref:Ribosomal protein S15 n=1 Tax=Heterostelium pallidum (strain ATCC 26659 / Pp 5 / PN500) TaxID=670386 RepID=D3BAP3_HETP5|nr:hypothetical protein PPL_05621 [Heterostelium album PN500]EFA81630.1 hypothetical protein PPL_05621 [Heterostelium album PN500]|eukprot:XP_020433747.1 hypothetical protein PPL_05621 [Heterostelium album PN500]
MMINILKRSNITKQLIESNKSAILNSFRYYSSSSNNNNGNKVGFENLKDFTDQFKNPKPFDYSQPIDYGFISKELNLPISEKGINLDKNQLASLGIDMDLSTAENHQGLIQLERLLRTPEGKSYLNLLIADIKSSFNIESEEQMKIRVKQLTDEYSLKLGDNVKIDQFIKENPDQTKLSAHQRDIVNDYIERHPYIKHIRQTALIMDLVDLVEVYNKSDSQTFQAEFDKKFLIKGQDNAELSRESEKNLRDQQFVGQEEVDDDQLFAESTDKQKAQDNILRMIKSDQLPAYLDQLFLSAQQTLVPKSAEQMEREATDPMFNELRAIEADFNEPLFPDADLVKPVEMQEQAKDPKSFLKYYQLYPAKVRKWIDYTHTPLGFYTGLGVWYNFPEWYSKNFPAMKPEQIVTEESVSSKFEEKELPEDLREVYRFGVTKEEAEILHPKLRDFLSFRNASQGEVNAYRRQVCIQKFGNDKNDTGSTSVQIAIFTERINYLEAHIQKNNKDNVAKRRLSLLQSKRKSMINYLKSKNVEEYFRVTKDLKIRNSIL